jgi:hypothetical protein
MHLQRLASAPLRLWLGSASVTLHPLRPATMLYYSSLRQPHARVSFTRERKALSFSWARQRSCRRLAPMRKQRRPTRFGNCVESMLMLFEGQLDITRQEDRVGRWMDTRIRMKAVNLQRNAHFWDNGCRFGAPLTLFLTPPAPRRPRDREPLFLGSCSPPHPLRHRNLAGR